MTNRTATRPGHSLRAPAQVRPIVEAMEGRVMLSVSPAGDEVLVNTNTGGHQSISTGRSVATDANGNSVIVWSSQSPNGTSWEWNVAGQRFDVNGAKIGGEFRVNTTV